MPRLAKDSESWHRYDKNPPVKGKFHLAFMANKGNKENLLVLTTNA